MCLVRSMSEDMDFFCSMTRFRNWILMNRWFSGSLAVAWTVLIFVGCTLPGKDLPSVHLFDHVDKVVHFTFFFVFQCLWTAFFRTRGIGLILILAIAYGFFLEYYQSHFVKGRSFDVWDGVADTLGAFCCVLWTKHPKCKQNVNH